MPHNRFYLPESYETGSTYALDGDEFHHLKNVMRIKAHDLVELFNGMGVLALATISSIEKQKAIVSITEILQKEEAPTLTFSLALAMIKLPRLEIAIEKCTEIGCSHFYLFDSLYSEKVSVSPNQRQRLTNLLISACKQSGRLFIPKLTYCKKIEEIPTNTDTFYGDTSFNSPFLDGASLRQKSPLMVIGPEKGFHPKEVGFLIKRKAHGIKLAPYILRAETAAIVASSQLVFGS